MRLNNRRRETAMSRVISDRVHSILHPTIIIVLILLSISQFLAGKTFGAPIVHQTPEFDGKEYSALPADHTTDWQWTLLTPSFDNNSNLVIGDHTLFSDTETAQRYLEGFSIGADRFLSIDDEEEYTEAAFVLFITLPILTMIIGIGAAFWWQFYARKHKKSAHRQHSWRPMRSLGTKLTELTEKHEKVTYFRSN